MLDATLIGVRNWPVVDIDPRILRTDLLAVWSIRMWILRMLTALACCLAGYSVSASHEIGHFASLADVEADWRTYCLGTRSSVMARFDFFWWTLDYLESTRQVRRGPPVPVWTPNSVFIPIPQGAYESVDIYAGIGNRTVAISLDRGDGLSFKARITRVKRYRDAISGGRYGFMPWMCAGSDMKCPRNDRYIELTNNAFGGPISYIEMQVQSFQVTPDNLICESDSFDDDAVLMALLESKSFYPRDEMSDFEFQLVSPEVGTGFATLKTVLEKHRIEDSPDVLLDAHYVTKDYEVLWIARGYRTHIEELRDWLSVFEKDESTRTEVYPPPKGFEDIDRLIGEIPNR